jgi:hypothetical protein
MTIILFAHNTLECLFESKVIMATDKAIVIDAWVDGDGE